MDNLALLYYHLGKLNNQANIPRNGLNIQQHIPQKSTQKHFSNNSFWKEIITHSGWLK